MYELRNTVIGRANFCGACGTAVGGVGASQVKNEEMPTLSGRVEPRNAIHESSFNIQVQEGNTVLEIHNREDFIEFYRLLTLSKNQRMTFEGKEIHLMADITVFDTTNYNTWSEVNRPRNFDRTILRDAPLFMGKFDGNGHTVMGLYMGSLFYRINNAVILNLNISHSRFFACDGNRRPSSS